MNNSPVVGMNLIWINGTLDKWNAVLKCLVKSLKNELWNFMVDTHAYCTHFIIDQSINVSLRTGCRT